MSGPAAGHAADPGVEVEVVVTEGLGNATYLIGLGDSAVVVDPPRDAWRLEPILRRRGWRLRHVVETHVHNDYLSGALELVEAHGAEVVAPARGGYAFAHRGLEGDDELELDGFRLIARATPGHTPEHLAWEVRADGATRAGAVLTGGSLLVGSVGRTDLLGAGRTGELTADQFRSLRWLSGLPDDTAVWPTHGSGSFCAAGPADRGRTSTIGTERWTNPLFGLTDPAAFARTLVGGFGPYPAYYAEMAPMNRAGPVVLGAAPQPLRLDPDGLRSAMADGARLVDARSRLAVVAGHIPGATAVELNDSFASYVGWLLPVGTPLVLVLPEPLDAATDEAVAQLLRIGFDRVVGVLEGGVERWVDDGGSLASVETVGVGELAGELAGSDGDAGPAPFLLDVRDPIEWRDEGFVDGALAIPVGELSARLDEVPTDRPITVMCRSGARAAIAANILERAGRDVRVVAVGGVPDLVAAAEPDQS
jgi:glyoxylase-like metal-dependent hydrolase (beta-lactamase superfamily II)/rhodanese-related sulfurtransferase